MEKYDKPRLTEARNLFARNLEKMGEEEFNKLPRWDEIAINEELNFRDEIQSVVNKNSLRPFNDYYDPILEKLKQQYPIVAKREAKFRNRMKTVYDKIKAGLPVEKRVLQEIKPPKLQIGWLKFALTPHNWIRKLTNPDSIEVTSKFW